MPSMMGLCESPIPSVKRPPAAALVVAACCAIASGWRGTRTGALHTAPNLLLDNGPAFREQQGALQDIPKLTNIAWPVVRLERGGRARRQGQGWTLELPREGFEERGREQRDVADALPQRRQMDLRDVQAVVQVAAKTPALHLGTQVAVGRGNDTDIDAPRLHTPHAQHFPRLEHAQQLRLQGQGQLADFIEKQRAAVGRLEQTDLVVNRARKRPSHVAEELAFEE